MLKRRTLALLTALIATVLALAACTDPDTSDPTHDYNVLEAARPVPIVASQGLGLMHRMDDGLTLSSASSSSLDLVTLEATDFDGHPFVHITFSAPGPIHNIWDYARTLNTDQWADTDPIDSPYGTIITGASTARSPISFMSNDLELLIDFNLTLHALGGETRLDRLVAATPTTILMLDTAGTYWDTTFAQPVDPTELDNAITQYEQVRDENNRPEVLQHLASHWKQVLSTQPDEITAASGPSVTMDALTEPDGTLNVTAALQALEQQQPVGSQRVDSRTPVCVPFLWWKICHTVEIGSISDSKQAHANGGALQSPGAFGLHEQFNMPVCIVGGTKSNAPAGCGPTAFASLLWRDWVDGETYLGITYEQEEAPSAPTPPDPIERDPRDPPTDDPGDGGGVWRCIIDPDSCRVTVPTPPAPPPGDDPIPIYCGGNPRVCTTTPPTMHSASDRSDRDPNGLLAALMHPDARGVPRLSQYMGACYFVSGSMVTPGNFVNGANAFLVSDGKQAASRGVGNRIRLTGNTSYLLGNALNASFKATMLRDQIGKNDNSMVALYWPKGVISNAGAHYSPIRQYRITSGGTYLLPDVAILATDTDYTHPGRRVWHSLSDIWLPATGVYYLDRY